MKPGYLIGIAIGLTLVVGFSARQKGQTKSKLVSSIFNVPLK